MSNTSINNLFEKSLEYKVLIDGNLSVGTHKIPFEKFLTVFKNTLQSKNITFEGSLNLDRYDFAYIIHGLVKKQNRNMLLMLTIPAQNTSALTLGDLLKTNKHITTHTIFSEIQKYASNTNILTLISLANSNIMLKTCEKFNDIDIVAIRFAQHMYQFASKPLIPSDLEFQLKKLFFSFHPKLLIYVPDSMRNPKISELLHTQLNGQQISARPYREMRTMKEIFSEIEEIIVDPLT